MWVLVMSSQGPVATVVPLLVGQVGYTLALLCSAPQQPCAEGGQCTLMGYLLPGVIRR